MMSKPTKLCTLFAFLCLALIFTAGPGHAESSSYTIDFKIDQFEFQKLDEYDLIYMTDGSSLADPGSPQLPQKQIALAIPAGLKVEKVSVEGVEKVLIPGEFNLYPAQLPRKIGSDDAPAFIAQDSLIYSSAAMFPGELAVIVNQADLAGQNIINLAVSPMQYNPAEKKLYLNTSMRIVVEGNPGYVCGDMLSPKASDKAVSQYEFMLKDMVANPEAVNMEYGFSANADKSLPEGEFDHVIITYSSFADTYQRLAAWHNQKGVRDTVITTAEIIAAYSGSDDAEKVRNFVIDANSTWGTMYFLMAGEYGYVPLVFRTYYETSTPSDEYFSDFDDDWVNEVYVGRVTTESNSAANLFIDKVLKYETDPPRSDYIRDALLLGMDLDAYTPCEVLKTNIASTIPTGYTITCVYDSYVENHRTAFINALNDGQHLVNHADHSNITVLGTGDYNHGLSINISTVNSLTNDNQMSIIVSNGCEANHFDYNDCIAEYFVTANALQAAVAFTGNTRSGLYYQGYPYSLTNDLDRRWWNMLFASNKYHLGEILTLIKNAFSNSNDGEKHSEWTFNLLGEPEMPIWTTEPDSFHVECESSIMAVESSFMVHVTDSTTGSDISNAYVVLWKDGEVYETGYTNAYGYTSMTAHPTSGGDMYVTVTRQNYLPYQYPVEVNDYVCGDANGDMTVSVSDAVSIINYIFIGGTPPDPIDAADCNCDGVCNVSDAVWIVNYVFIGASAPCDTDGNGSPDC